MNKLDQLELERWATTAWAIWNGRNRFYFEHVQVHPQIIFDGAIAFLDEYQRLMSANIQWEVESQCLNSLQVFKSIKVTQGQHRPTRYFAWELALLGALLHVASASPHVNFLVPVWIQIIVVSAFLFCSFFFLAQPTFVYFFMTVYRFTNFIF